jgi:hypothetical protein
MLFWMLSTITASDQLEERVTRTEVTPGHRRPFAVRLHRGRAGCIGRGVGDRYRALRHVAPAGGGG